MAGLADPDTIASHSRTIEDTVTLAERLEREEISAGEYVRFRENVVGVGSFVRNTLLPLLRVLYQRSHSQ